MRSVVVVVVVVVVGGTGKADTRVNVEEDRGEIGGEGDRGEMGEVLKEATERAALGVDLGEIERGESSRFREGDRGVSAKPGGWEEEEEEGERGDKCGRILGW